MTKHDRIIIILDPTFEIIMISLLWTELLSFPKKGKFWPEIGANCTLCSKTSSVPLTGWMYFDFHIKDFHKDTSVKIKFGELTKDDMH